MTENSPLSEALNLKRSRFIEASAGTGKTYALTKRYCRIMDDFAGRYLREEDALMGGVNNILVITFTRKAAAEMGERIYRELTEMMEARKGMIEVEGMVLNANLQRLPEAKRRELEAGFPGNYISTIDSFCGRILKENYFRIGLEPNFALEEDAFDPGYEEILLEKFIRRLSRKWDDRLEKLLNNADIRQVKEYFKYLYENRQFLSGWREYYGRTGAEEIWQRWIKLYCPQFEAKYVLQKLNEIADYNRVSFKNGDDGGKIFLTELKRQTDSLPIGDDTEARYAIIDRILKPMFITKEGEYRKRFEGNKSNWANSGQCEEYKQAAKELTEYLAEHLPASRLRQTPDENDARAVEILRALAGLYGEYEDEMNAYKQSRRFLSFNDVIILTHKLLTENEEVRAKYQRQFRHIMIDEFQDTNDLRWEIIQSMCRGEEGKLRKEGIFIVGDKKQSIYGFQQAEVEVMDHALKALQEGNDAEEEVCVRLKENFRSSENYIKYGVNTVFTKIMPGAEKAADLPDYEVYFYPAEYGARKDAGEIERRRIEAATPNVCSIQGVIAGEDEDAEGREYLPALHTVWTVKKMLKWAEECGIKENPAVAVLFQRFTKIQRYIDAFQKYGVDFEIFGGRGLFKQQEAWDLFHLVSILLNPLDDYALVGLLRSPVFGVSDNIIQGLGIGEEGRAKNEEGGEERRRRGSLLEVMKTVKGMEGAAEEIEKWRDWSRTMPLDRLLQKIIDSPMRQFGYISETGGRQRLGNLNLLIDLTHRLSLGGMGLAEAHCYLRYAMRNEESAQAELPGAARVQLMTIHKAKGLEFPAVVIPEMNGYPHRGGYYIAHGSLLGGGTEVGLAITDDEGTSQKTGLLKAIMEQAKLKEAAEELRLFYVAVTRAKYRAAMLGEFKEPGREIDSWWRRFIRGGGLCPEGFNAEEWGRCGDESGKSTVELRKAGEIREELEGGTEKTWEAVPFVPYVKRELAGFYEETNPHQLMTRFFPNGKDEGGERNVRGETADSLAAGTVFHFAAEREMFDYEQYEEEFRLYLEENYPELGHKEILTRVKRNLETFIESGLYAKLNSGGVSRKCAESEIRGWLSSEKSMMQVAGRMDLLYQSEGKWYCLDYKTDSDKGRIDSYRFQMQTYLWMIKQVYGIDAAGKLYFTALDETVEVEFDDSYFRHFREHFGEEFKPAIPNTAVDPFIIENIRDILQSEEIIPAVIIVRTVREAADLWKGLADIKAMQPGVKIKTVREMMMEHRIAGRRMSPLMARLAMEKILTEMGAEYQSKAHAEKLAEAVSTGEEWGIEVREEFRDAEDKFRSLRRAQDWRTEKEIAEEITARGDFNGKTVILTGIRNVEPSIFNLLKGMAEKAKSFYFIDVFTQAVKREFNYDNSVYEHFTRTMPDSGQSYQICQTVEEEVELAVRRIMAIPDWEKKLGEIKITVSSMEVYVPVIKRVFGGCGIPVTIFKNEPVMERPAAQLVRAALQVMAEKGELEWKAAANVTMNPLMPPEREIYLLDKWVRKHNIESYSALEDFFAGGKSEMTDLAVRRGFEQVKAIIDILRPEAGEIHPYKAVEILKYFIQKYRIERNLSGDAVSAGVLKLCYEAVEHILHSYSMLEMKPDLPDFIYDLRLELAKSEVRTGRREWGVEVLGYLDCAHLAPEYLLVMGMFEGQFPQAPESHPLLSGALYNYYHYDLTLLKQWLGLKGKVRYTAARRLPDGRELTPSTFLKFLRPEEYMAAAGEEAIPQHYYFRKYYRRKVDNPSGLNWLERHNQYLSAEDAGSFRGMVKIPITRELEISSSGMDDLLRCPMKYWFSKVLRLEIWDKAAEKEDKIKLGTILHQALSSFGSKAGFELAKDNMTAAAELLDQELTEAGLAENVDLREDLLQKSRFRFYLNGLKELSDKNILVRSLKWNTEELKEYRADFFEKKFGYAESETGWQEAILPVEEGILKLKGKIDKIMLREDGDAVLATDYKTGKVDISDIKEHWSSQFPIYFFALKSAFPGKRVLMVYEILRNLQECGVSALFGEVREEDATLLSGKYKKRVLPLGEAGEGLTVEEIIKIYGCYAGKAMRGEFHIAERELHGKACEYCEYAALCRKDCVRTV